MSATKRKRPAATTPAEDGARPEIVSYSEPSFRSYPDWTPALIRAAELQADAGTLRLAADLCEKMLADDRIKAVVDTRTDELLGRALTFDGRSKRAVKALEAGEDWWSAFPEWEIKLLLSWRILLGVAVAEIVWTRDGDRDVPHMVVKNPRFLRWDWVKRQWLLAVDTGTGGSTEVVVTPGDGKWLLYAATGASRPWVHGAYRALARWMLLKRYAIDDWGFYSERHGQGILVATGAEGNAQQRKEISADLRTLGRNAALALPKGFDLKLVEATAKSWETFKAQIDTADNGAAITVLGQNLTTNVDGGSRAAASVHGRVALGRTKADGETLSTAIHDQVLTWWARFNWGNASYAPWPVWDTSPIEDIKELAGTLQMVSQAVASFVTAGAPVDVPALLRQFKVPVLEQPVVAAVPPPPAGTPTEEIPS